MILVVGAAWPDEGFVRLEHASLEVVDGCGLAGGEKLRPAKSLSRAPKDELCVDETCRTCVGGWFGVAVRDPDA